MHGTQLKNCKRLAAIRSLAGTNEEIKTSWIEKVEPLAAFLRNRFLRLKLKDDVVVKRGSDRSSAKPSEFSLSVTGPHR